MGGQDEKQMRWDREEPPRTAWSADSYPNDIRDNCALRFCFHRWKGYSSFQDIYIHASSCFPCAYPRVWESPLQLVSSLWLTFSAPFRPSNDRILALICEDVTRLPKHTAHKVNRRRICPKRWYASPVLLFHLLLHDLTPKYAIEIQRRLSKTWTLGEHYEEDWREGDWDVRDVVRR